MHSQSEVCPTQRRPSKQREKGIAQLAHGARLLVIASILLTSCQLDKLLSSGKLNDGSGNDDPPGGNVELVATRVSFDVQPSNAQAATAISPALQVSAKDESGATVTSFTGNITIEISANPSGGVLSGTASRAAVAGVATFSGIAIDKPGTGYRLRATSGTLTIATSNAFNITAAPVQPNTLSLVSGNTQTGTAGTALANPYVVLVRNAAGQPVSGITVNWAIVTGGGSIAGTSLTNSSGQASATHTLGSTVGAHRVTASVAGATGSPITFDATATAVPPPPATRIALVSGNSQSDTISATLAQPYVVLVTNAASNPVAGVTVTWSVTGATDGSITPFSAQTDALGRASASHKLGTIVGAHSVTASAQGLQGSPITFTSTATHGKPARLVFTQQPSTTERNKDINPDIKVTVQDRAGNTATTATAAITLSIVPLTGTPLAQLSGDLSDPPSSGTATYNDIRINLTGSGYRLRATSAGLTVDSNPFNITPSEQW